MGRGIAHGRVPLLGACSERLAYRTGWLAGQLWTGLGVGLDDQPGGGAAAVPEHVAISRAQTGELELRGAVREDSVVLRLDRVGLPIGGLQDHRDRDERRHLDLRRGDLAPVAGE